MLGYVVDGGEVHVVDLAAGEEIPEEILAALSDEDVTKWAFNSSFERICLSEWLRRNHPEHDPEKWELFKCYNRRDVEVEQSIQKKLHSFTVPDFVWEECWLDQEINDRGILLDLTLVENAIALDEISKDKLSDAMKDITELENPNSVAQMKQWLSDQGVETDSLGKKDVAKMIADDDIDEDVSEALRLRQQLAKSSVKKYQAMQTAVCRDGRARGMFQFYGANRSGRWVGVSSSCRIFRRTIWMIWNRPEGL